MRPSRGAAPSPKLEQLTVFVLEVFKLQSLVLRPERRPISGEAKGYGID
jgi:hypothetical protein